MSEGWVDCPALGPGWKRRVTFRKTGATLGRTDTYYQSPTGERFRSKIELTNFLGINMDLSSFDFKSGVMRSPSTTAVRKTTKKKKISKSEDSGNPKKKKKKKPKPEPVALSLSAETVNGDATSAAIVPTSAPGAPETFIVCCEGCNQWVSGVLFGKSRFSKWYCSDCRARKRIFSKQQRVYKEFGCGECAACQITEDCQLCTICRLKAENKEYDHTWKCIKRRCQKIVRKVYGCKHCEGCLSMEDCGTCKPCLRAQDNPNRRRTWKCIKRRCVNQHKLKAKKMGEKKSGKSSEKQQASLETESLPIQQQEDEIVQKCATPVENVLTPAEKIGRPSGSLAMEDNPLVKEVHKKPRVKIEGEPKILKKKKSRKNTEENQQCITSELGPDGYLYYVDSNVLPYSSRRKSRMCGECEACVQKVDCGSCDFCQDKPKFGGINRKRQKCRWRQCLRYAMKRLLPEVWGNLKGDQLGSMVALSLNHRKNVFAYRKLVKIKQAARRVRQVGMLFARAWEEEAVIAKEGKHINHMKGVPGFYTTPVAQQLSVKQEVMEGRLSQQFIQPVDTHLEQPTEFFKPSTEEQHPPPQLRQQMIDTHFSQQCVPQEYSQIGNVPGYYGSSMEQQQQHFKQEMIEERFDQQHIPHEKHHLPYGLENGAVKSFDNHVEPIRQFYSTHTEQRQVKRESVEMMISAQQCLPSEAGYGLRPPVTCQPSVPTIWPEPPQNPLPKNSTRAQEHTAEISQNFQVMSDMPTRNQRVLELKEGMMNDTSGSQHTVLEEQDVVCLTPAVTEHVAICQPKEANETVVLDQDVICLPQETSEHLVLCGPEEADESTPVITEIFSLGSYHSMSNLDGVLQEFLMELNELPLPAHWEVLHPAGPDLRLVQRSKLSNMSDTVIHIQPGLVYYIMVKDVPVPLQHEVFSTHPTRFRTVDDVVELICDLEAYRPCAGYQQGSNEICMSYLGARSPLCDVLVYGERCERCRINPAALRH